MTYLVFPALWCLLQDILESPTAVLDHTQYPHPNPSSLGQRIIPQTPHTHPLHPSSTRTIALHIHANIPRPSRQQPESVGIETHHRARRIIDPHPRRYATRSLHGEIPRRVRVAELQARIGELGFGEGHGGEEVLVVEGSIRAGVGERAGGGEIHVKD